MTDQTTNLSDLKAAVKAFTDARGWGPWQKALSLAISINLEAAELLEIFQWCDKAEADRKALDTDREHFLEELADVMIYCVSLANACDVDIAAAISDKLEKNAKKYPVREAQP